MAISVVIIASISPSNTSTRRSRIAGLVIRWPTLRTSISARPFTVNLAPSGAV
jgi:hypothetical protein